MSAFIVNRFWSAVAVLAAGAAGLSVPVSASAGEPIRFGGDKVKSAPDAQSKIPQDRSSPLDRIPATTPFDAINSSGANMSSRRLDPKEEKRLKNAKLEKENWMILDRGELQDKDDQETEFGIRDYSGDNLEKEEKGAGAIWFGPNQERTGRSASQSRATSGNSRISSPNRPQPAPRRIDNDANFGAAKISNFDSGTTPGQGQVKEVSLQNLAPGSDANNVLKDLFNGGPGGTRLADEPNRGRDSFGLRSINVQPEPGLSGFGRGYGLNAELARPASGPSPSLIEGSRTQPGSLGGGLGSSLLRDSPKYDLNNASRSSVSPLAPPRNDYTPGSTRDIFTPPPRPGSLGSR